MRGSVLGNNVVDESSKLRDNALGGQVWQPEDMAEFVKREHSKGDIDRAGTTLVSWWKETTIPPFTDEERKAYHIVENWRTCHALPLNAFRARLHQSARRREAGALIAQRLKRFSSLMNKLVREPAMKLSQMQDLGGCRAILSSIQAVDTLAHAWCKREPTFKCHDYIRNPKDDGYRGIHIVARYHPRIAEREPWNGQRIEIQLRSRLQHAFATAVETVTTFTREPLKFGAGPPEWRRFFSLMGSAVALREGTRLVEGTPISTTELINELRELAKQLTVHKRLRGWTAALEVLPREKAKQFTWLLLVLNLAENTFRVRGYPSRKKAAADLAELEQTGNKDIDAVLVWVPSARDLKAAYPNYYADTRDFLSALDTALATKGI